MSVMSFYDAVNTFFVGLIFGMGFHIADNILRLIGSLIR